MDFWILTLFPQMFSGVVTQSILKKAQEKKIIKIKLLNIRDFAEDKHQSVDDKPYGGGKGMILKVDVVIKALKSIKPKPYSVLLSPTGILYTQKNARELSQKKSLAIICGHYEGVDARIENFVDEIISIGDFILTGGEVAAITVIDSVTRLIPRVIHPESLESESFSEIRNSKFKIQNLLEYPQYTRPENFQGLKVPKVLLSGNHQEIIKWRKEQSFSRTKKIRPDLLRKSKSK